MRAAEIVRRGLIPSLLLVSASLRGETGVLSLPSPGARLNPGLLQETAWESGAPDPGIDESELVLSLDGGRTFPIRLSAEIEPGETRAEWRVPDLPTAHARLALRIGREGAAETERIERVSAEFTILADDGATPERLFRIDGEWRTREALAPAQRTPLSSFVPPDALTSLAKSDESAVAPRPDSLVVPLVRPSGAAARETDPPRPATSAPRAFASVFPPLRL